ncbi:MAG TPA: hypothetical protein VEI48_08400 [Candidatus Sulfotelmatobacter sp.]|nr:hypothetical protein [Candidatus Sulfotelmatobacter sp.]
MSDYPDVYADGYAISAGPYGVTLTLHRSEPTGAPGPHAEPTQIVARLRFNHALGKAIADGLLQTMAAAAAQAIPPTNQPGIKH